MTLIDAIGNTPLIEVSRLQDKPGVKLFAKMEGHNPGGSVKDRAAYGMLKGALDKGMIKSGDRLIEATSGNTGIALAMIAKLLGLKMTLIMPANSTEERKQTMRAFGAELILTSDDGGIEYARTLAEEMAQSQGMVLLNQFANPDNWNMHYRSTGPEIWRDTHGRVTHFVSAMGTTGTIMGVSRFLKEQNPNIQIVGTQPVEGASIPGIRRWSPEFVPAIFEPSRVDQIIDVSEAEARYMAIRLAREEAIFSGMSSGGACTAALHVASQIDEGVVVFIVCDRGDRYLSSGLFA